MGTSTRPSAPMHGDSVKPPRNPMLQMVQAFAGGGLIGGAVDEIKSRQNVLDSIDSAPAPAAPSPAQAKPSMGSEADTYAAQAASIEAEQQAAAKTRAAAAKPKSFLDKLGFSDGGKIDGPGTPTSDSIPAVVEDTGQEIRVANKERILSAGQDAFLEKLAKDLGFENLEAMLESGTGKPVGPTLKDGIPAAAYGAEEETLKNVMNTTIGNQPRPEAQPMNQSMTSAVTGVNRSGNSFSQAAGSDQPATTPIASPAVAPVARDRFGNDMTQTNAMKAQLSALESPKNPMDNAVAPARFTAPAATPVTTIGNGQSKDFSMIAADPIGAASVKTMPPRAEVPEVPQATFKPQFQQGDVSMRAADPKGYAAVSGQQPGAQERTFGASSLAPESQATGASAAAPTPIQQGAQERTFQAPTQPEPAAEQPFKSRVGNSFTERNTVMDTKNPLTSIDMAGNNASLAKANAIRQSTIGAQAGDGPKVTTLGDSGRAESQNLMDKWGREDAANSAAQAIAANPKSANALASLFSAQAGAETARSGQQIAAGTAQLGNETTRRGQDVNSSIASEGHSVTARGQDISANTAANQLAGNPLDNELKQSSVDMNKRALTKAQQQDKAIEGIGFEQDPTRRRAMMDALLVSQGKNPAEHRYLKVEGGEEMAPDGYTKIKRPSGVYDTTSGKFIPMDGNAPAGGDAARKIKADLAAGKIKREDAIKQLKAMGYQ